MRRSAMDSSRAEEPFWALVLRRLFSDERIIWREPCRRDLGVWVAYDIHGVRFLFHAADLGVDFSSPATLGHLFLFADEVDLAQALAACRGEKSPELANEIYRDCAGHV